MLAPHKAARFKTRPHFQVCAHVPSYPHPPFPPTHTHKDFPLSLLDFNALLFFLLLPPQIFVISQAEPRLPLQLDDAVRPDGDGEEVSEDECRDG